MDKIEYDIEAAGEAHDQWSEEIRACLNKPFEIGDESNFGLVTNLRGPLIEVQEYGTLRWIKASDAKHSARSCQ